MDFENDGKNDLSVTYSGYLRANNTDYVTLVIVPAVTTSISKEEEAVESGVAPKEEVPLAEAEKKEEIAEKTTTASFLGTLGILVLSALAVVAVILFMKHKKEE